MLPDEVEPSRPWEELIAGSARRGKQIRRRRHAVMAGSPVGVALIAIAVLLAGGTGNSDSLRVVPPAAPPTSDPQPSAAGSVSSGSAPVQTGGETEASSAAGSGGGAGFTTEPGSPPRTEPTGLPLPPPPAAQPGGQPSELPRVSFTDTAGDGTPENTPVASDPAFDIVKMAYTATRTGLQIDMWLAGNNSGDGYYTATFMSGSGGCGLTVRLGGSFDDAYTTTCSSGAKSIPNTVDPSAAHLRAVVPFSLLPDEIDPADTLSGLGGRTQMINSLGATTSYDEASSNLTIQPRP